MNPCTAAVENGRASVRRPSYIETMQVIGLFIENNSLKINDRLTKTWTADASAICTGKGEWHGRVRLLRKRG